MGPGSTPGHKTRPAAGRGGLCAPNRTSAPALPGTSELVVWLGVDSGISAARALLQVQKPTRVRLAAILAVLDDRKTSRAEKIFFVKKWAYGKYGGPFGGAWPRT